MNDAGPSCTFCESTDVETVAAWGGQLITTQLRCRGCNTYFEALRVDFDPHHSEPPEAGAE
jgi:hypothetical protein